MALHSLARTPVINLIYRLCMQHSLISNGSIGVGRKFYSNPSRKLIDFIALAQHIFTSTNVHLLRWLVRCSPTTPPVPACSRSSHHRSTTCTAIHAGASVRMLAMAQTAHPYRSITVLAYYFLQLLRLLTPSTSSGVLVFYNKPFET